MFLLLQRLQELGQIPRAVLLLGIAVRVLTYLFLGPANNDDHAEVVKFIAANGRLPLALDLLEGQHPPLYYLLVTPLWIASHSLKVVQAFSLICSIATLIVFYRLLYREGLIENPLARLSSFCIACFLPQFVMFSLYVSNDSLTFLLGAVAMWQTYRYIRSPNLEQLILLAGLTGIGLATKYTFAAILPILVLLVLWVSSRHSLAKAAGSAGAFLAIALTLGSYKFVENYINEGSPLIQAMDDPRWELPEQQQTYRGVSSYLDFNLLHLLEAPTLSPATTGSYPLLLYGTFWYQHIPESDWKGNLRRRFNLLAPAIDIVALIPTAFFFVGMAALGKRLPDFARSFDLNRPADQRLLTIYVAVAELLVLLAMMLWALDNYHVWSIMQGRFLFPMLFAGMGAFSVGVETASRSKFASLTLKAGLGSLLVLFGLYFASEVALRVHEISRP